MAAQVSGASEVLPAHEPAAAAPIHVLLVNASEHVFGAERSLAGLVAALAEQGCRFTLASPGGACGELFASLGVETRQIPLRRFRLSVRPGSLASQTLRWIRGNWALFQLCRRSRADVIHVNGIQSMLYVPLTLLLLRRPVVWHVRDLHSPGIVARICCGLSRAIVAPSVAVLEDLPGGRDKAWVVPNPTSLPNSSTGCSNRIAVRVRGDSADLLEKSGGYKIGLVGQVIPRKGHDLLLRAAPAILDRIPDARFFFVGGDQFDPDSEYVRSLRREVAASERLRGRVYFLDYETDVGKVYRKLDVSAVPSRSEAFGRVALEAMGFGCPVVAARTGGLAENIRHRHNGLLFEAQDAEGLASCISELATDVLLANRIVHNGKLTAIARSGREPAAARAVKDIYNHVLLSDMNRIVLARRGSRAGASRSV